jgi:cytochrome c oxidase subunit 1
LPLTIWTMLVASILGLLTFPPLTAAAIMLLFDRHFGTSFFVPGGLYVGGSIDPHMGGTPLLWQHLFWFLGHPEVYVLILPALGLTFDVLAAFTRKPVFGYKMVVVSLIVIAVLSVVVWGHHMFVSGMNPYLGEFFTVGTLLVTIPSAVIGLCLIASLWGGSLRLRTPMLWVLGTIALFGTGGFGGIFLGNATSDIFLHDSAFVVGHFHFMIGGVTLFATFAATYFWFPKMFGRALNDTLGKIHFWLTFPSFYAIFLTMHFVGLDGTPRRYYALNQFELTKQHLPQEHVMTLAAFILGLAALLFIFNFFWSLARGRKVSRNPWHATTLEWTASSPPPHGNWEGAVPEVHRWPYEYSVEGVKEDFTPQTVEPARAKVTM